MQGIREMRSCSEAAGSVECGERVFNETLHAFFDTMPATGGGVFLKFMLGFIVRTSYVPRVYFYMRAL